MRYFVALSFVVATAAIAQIEATPVLPNMILADENRTPIEGVSASTRVDKLQSKALELGDHDYIIIRPDGTLKVRGTGVEYGEVVVPDPEPTPDPNEPIIEPTPDPNEPPSPPSGPVDARFAALLESPNLHDYLAMNKHSEICENTRPCVNKGEQNPIFSYDANENAFLATIEKDTRLDVTSRWQIRRYFEQVGFGNADKISFQWEFKFNETYNSPAGLNTYKAFQLSTSSEGLYFELQVNFKGTDSTVVAYPSIRYYKGIAYTEAHDNEPLSSYGPPISSITGSKIDNWQPGGETAVAYRDSKIGNYNISDHVGEVNKYEAETGLPSPTKFNKPYLIRANSWTRVTIDFDFTTVNDDPESPYFGAKQLRMNVWMSDEQTPPALIISSVREPGKAFLLSEDLTKTSIGFQNWWLELNTSQVGVHSQDAKVWTKNFVVYKNAFIPKD